MIHNDNSYYISVICIYQWIISPCLGRIDLSARRVIIVPHRLFSIFLLLKNRIIQWEKKFKRIRSIEFGFDSLTDRMIVLFRRCPSQLWAVFSLPLASGLLKDDLRTHRVTAHPNSIRFELKLPSVASEWWKQGNEICNFYQMFYNYLHFI